MDSLEKEAEKRRQRLKAMRQQFDQHDEAPTDAKQSSPPIDDDDDDDQNAAAEQQPLPSFRSYQPMDERLRSAAVERQMPSDVVEHVQEQLDAATPQPLLQGDDLDVNLLAPRKPNWDLKRDIAKRLERLERRTQKVIAELVRERELARKEGVHDEEMDR